MSDYEHNTPVDRTEQEPVMSSTELDGSSITLKTLISYLFGSREAILTLASHRDTVGLGLIFVLSAALAREYDGEDLLYEPWHLLPPLAASLGTSFLLFGLVHGLATCRGAKAGRFGARYRAFLGLYWMTAPMAWLYAIPVERFLPAGDAASANMRLLAIVSLWRVLLITRVCSVLYGAAFADWFYLVMLFADSMAITLVSYIDVQVFAIMGGVRLTEAESVLAGTKMLVLFFGVLSWPIWLIGTAIVAFKRSPHWSWKPEAHPVCCQLALPVRSFAIASVLIWVFVLPWTQPEQQLRGVVERNLRSGRYRKALTIMSAHQRDEFPSHWDPPPRIGFNRERPRILKVVSSLSNDDAPWVRELFIDKLNAALGRHDFPMETLWLETDLDEILTAVESLPEGEEILRSKQKMLNRLASWGERSEKTKARLKDIDERSRASELEARPQEAVRE